MPEKPKKPWWEGFNLEPRSADEVAIEKGYAKMERKRAREKALKEREERGLAPARRGPLPLYKEPLVLLHVSVPSSAKDVLAQKASAKGLPLASYLRGILLDTMKEDK